MIKERTNQGGSVATFVVVGIILVAVLIGGIYLVNIRGQQARKSQEIATSETQKPVSTGSSTTNTSSNSSNSTQQTSTSSAQEESSASEEATSQNLPTTGVGINWVKLAGVYLLTVSLTAYVLSRRNLARSL